VEDDPFSPEERAVFSALTDVIEDELSAQIPMKRLEALDGEHVMAQLLADRIWDYFEVRVRPT
jgi:hypothetical protein